MGHGSVPCRPLFLVGGFPNERETLTHRLVGNSKGGVILHPVILQPGPESFSLDIESREFKEAIIRKNSVLLSALHCLNERYPFQFDDLEDFFVFWGGLAGVGC